MNEESKKNKIKYDLLILIPGLAFLVSLIILYFVLTMPAGWENRKKSEHHQKDLITGLSAAVKSDPSAVLTDETNIFADDEFFLDDDFFSENDLLYNSISGESNPPVPDSGMGRGRGRGSGHGPWWRNKETGNGDNFVPHRQIRRKVFTTVLVILNILFLATLVFAMKFRDKVIKKDQQISNFDRLTRSFSHEVLNPLNAISLCSQAIHRDLKKHRQSISSYPGIEEKFTIIQGEIERLTSIVRGFRSLSGNIIPEITDVKISDLLEECRTLFKDQANVAGIEIYVEAEDEILIKADRNLLKQVLINFIKNSIEAIRELKDRKNSRIVLSVRSLGNHELECSENCLGQYKAVISVEDTGPGIKTKKIEKIFEYTYTDKAEGLGIGLAISKKIIQAHNWEVRAENISPDKESGKNGSKGSHGARLTIFV